MQKRFLSLLLVCVCIAPVLFMAGCDDEDTKPFPGPPLNTGLVPFYVANTWRYDVNRTVLDCTGHPLAQCRFDECFADCNFIWAQGRDFCFEQFELCQLENIPLDLCERNLEACLANNLADRNACVVASDCARFLNDPFAVVCGTNTCLFMDENGDNAPGQVPCKGMLETYDKCPHFREILYFTDTITSVAELEGTKTYAYNGDFYRFNDDGGVYYYGSRAGRPYQKPILEFAYPATVGHEYTVNYEERGAYAVTVVSTNHRLDADTDPDLANAVAAHRGQPFYTYHYRFVRQDLDECGCREEFNYYIAPGVGFVKIEGKFGTAPDGSYVRTYRQTLTGYTILQESYYQEK